MKQRGKARWHKEVREFYRQTHTEYEFSDDEERILHAICENLDIFWRATDQLTKEGLTFVSENGMIRKHPACEISKNAWAAFLAGCRMLGIGKQQVEQPKRGPGRPPATPPAFGGF